MSNPFELRDPGALVEQVLYGRRVAEGDAFVALVRDATGVQELVHVTSIPPTTWASLDRPGRSDFLRQCVHDMPIDTETWRRPEHTVITIVVRSGLAVFSADELSWLLAWRYANHLAPVLDAGLILITEFGWVDFMSGRGDFTPRLATNRSGTAQSAH